MPTLYERLVGAVTANPLLHRAALRAQLLVPDVPVTRDVPRLGRFRFRLRRHRWMLGSNPFSTGEHDQTMRTFARLWRPGMAFYDVGANVGYYTRLVLQELNPSHVVAFEPMSENLDLLRSNVALGGFADRVTVLPLALSDREGSETLQIDDIMGGSAVLNSVSGGEAAEPRKRLGLKPKTESVEVRTLDGLLADRSLPAPGLIKIDTEGAEAQVLAGAVQTLKTHRPRLAIATHGAYPARATIELLNGLGWVVRGFVHGETAERALLPDDAPRLTNNNLIAGVDL